MRKKIMINDIPIWIHELNNPIERENFNEYCVICEKKIKMGDEISLLMNNNKLFPNIWIHNKHISDKYDLKWTMTYIIYKYQKYLSFKNEYKIWENHD